MTMLTAPPRDDLERSVAFDLVRADEGSDGLTLEGYAAVFNAATEIDSWEGTFSEKIAPGAFRKSVRERTPRLQFDHGRHPLIGSVPIGRFTSIKEDARGLYVEARLTDNWLVQPIRDAIAEGAIDGMSFRFSVVREEWRDNAGKLIKAEELPRLLWDAGDRGPLERTLKEVKIAEAGPVVWPAYEETSVSVRARDLASTIRGDVELRRDIRRSLAMDVPPGADDLADPKLRAEVACALVGTKTSGEPLQQHSPEPARTSDDAPPSGHSLDDDDAPPSDGHPSMTDTDDVKQLRSNIREVTGLMGTKLASITKDI
jgi:HK97 family phage prohead protease